MSNLIITDNGVMDDNQSLVSNGSSGHIIYEVLRIIDGVPLFIEDHFDRLLSSARISGVHLNMQLADFERSIKELTIVNNQDTGNIKFLLIATDNINHWSFSFIPHKYPTKNDYHQGVPAGLLYAERVNPEAKVIQQSVREKADQMIADKKLYEVLLVDRNGLITEGSRSNVFFVKEERFYTAPDKMVLSGVTRKKVLDCLKELNFKVIEQAVSAKEIGNYEATFLTGTSPKVLPIHVINECNYKTSHPLMKSLMDLYDKKIDDYILSKKKCSHVTIS